MEETLHIQLIIFLTFNWYYPKWGHISVLLVMSLWRSLVLLIKSSTPTALWYFSSLEVISHRLHSLRGVTMLNHSLNYFIWVFFISLLFMQCVRPKWSRNNIFTNCILSKGSEASTHMLSLCCKHSRNEVRLKFFFWNWIHLVTIFVVIPAFFRKFVRVECMSSGFLIL